MRIKKGIKWIFFFTGLLGMCLLGGCSEPKTIDEVFTPNKTSAKLLINVARLKMKMDSANVSMEAVERYALLYDVYIKARTYAIINKISFILSIVLGISVLVWPAVAVISKQFGLDWELFKSAVIQTTITALAALTFAVYTHYKGNQTQLENLMRSAVYSQESLPELKQRIIKEMERIDNGFNFSGSIPVKAPGPQVVPADSGG